MSDIDGKDMPATAWQYVKEEVSALPKLLRPLGYLFAPMMIRDYNRCGYISSWTKCNSDDSKCEGYRGFIMANGDVAHMKSLGPVKPSKECAMIIPSTNTRGAWRIIGVNHEGQRWGGYCSRYIKNIAFTPLEHGSAPSAIPIA